MSATGIDLQEQLDLFEIADVCRPLTCPACGYSANSTMWGMRTYHGWSDDGEPCQSMVLRRRHALHVLRMSPEDRAERDRAARRGHAPHTVAETLGLAIESWGEAAREFIPADAWPSAE
ncbi:hypothetical protein GCM10028787_31030 [Brachybacterium horti]